MTDRERLRHDVYEVRGGEQEPKLHITRAAFNFQDVCVSTFIKDGVEKPAGFHAIIRERFREEISKRYNLSNGQLEEVMNIPSTEGFMDSEGNFNGRVKSGDIALAAGQIGSRVTELESEDILRDKRYPR